MLRIVSKFFFYITLIFLFSCSQKSKDDYEKYTEISMNQIGKSDYWRVYQQANDSIQSWVDNNFQSFSYQRVNNWRLDSLVCFNKKRTKCVMSINTRAIAYVESVQDGIDIFYGVKIKGSWYFFLGPAIIISREYYQKETDTPLSFNELHKIAMKEVFHSYLKRNAQGKWEINEDFFSDLTSCAWSEKWKTNTQTEWDSIYLEIIAKQWADHRKEIFKEREKEKQRKTIELSHRLLDSIRANKKE